MRPNSLIALTTAFSLALMTLPATAQTTPSALLAEWQQSFSDADQALEFSDREDVPGGLRLTDVTTAIPVQGGKLRITVPEIILTDTGSGEVQIEIPSAVLMVLRTDETTVAGRLTHEALDLIAGGSAEARTYSYNAARADYVLDAATDENGTPIPLEVSVALEEVATDYMADGMRLTSDYTLGAVQIDLSGEDDTNGPPTSFSLNYRMTGINGDSDAPSGTMFQSADPSAIFESGASLTATLVHSGTGYTFESSGPDANMLLDGSSAGGALGMALGEQGLAYDIAAQGVKWRFAGDQLPFPVELGLDSVGFDISTPILENPEPQPFGLRLSLGGLTGSNGLWSLFDPSEVLPRDPGEILIDLSGTQRVLQTLTDTDPQNQMVPVEFTSLNLNDLLVSIIGAQLTGEGSFQLDPSAPGMVPGVPAAVGKVELRLNGANALIDRLVQIGIMQPQDVMGVRMMMGMAARPGDTPDSLVSTIQLTPDGGLIANGMQLR
jgi:hypothetical protein